MLSDLAFGLLLWYCLACAIPHAVARRRQVAGRGWLLAWTLLAGWTVWGWLAALGYALLAEPLSPRSAPAVPPAPSPAGR